MAEEQAPIWRTPPGEKAEGDLVDQLTDHGRDQMLREIVTAFKEAPRMEGEAVAQIVEAYWRTAHIRQSPGYEKIKDRIGKSAEELGERSYTVEELREQIDLLAVLHSAPHGWDFAQLSAKALVPLGRVRIALGELVQDGLVESALINGRRQWRVKPPEPDGLGD